jgi:CelD/BcsL family acetyltransferase involved in cellulose biosynthesis
VSLRCESITDTGAWVRLEPLWRDLFAHGSAPSPFHSWDFAVEWWRHWVSGRVGGATGRFEVVVVFDGDGNGDERAVAVLPFYFENNLGRAGLGMTLQPFGRSNATEPMTDEPVALYRKGFELAAADAVKLHLAASRDGRAWDIAAVRGACTAGTGLPRPPQFSARLSALEVTRPCFAPVAIPWAPSWEHYRSTLSKSMRDNIAYYPKRLTRDHGAWSVRAHRTPGEVAAATEILIAQHRRRSTATTGTPHYDHIATAGQAQFLRRWFQRQAARGQVSILTLEVAGHAVAVQAFVEAPGCVAVYYSGFEESFHRYSPLTIITAAAIEDTIRRRVGRFEFPPTMFQWKSRWNARERKHVLETSLYSTSPSSLARGVVRRVYQRVGGW